MDRVIQVNQISINRAGMLPGYQAGIITTFTGVLILVLLTLMMFFAVRVGVFEQRVSANDSRQKLAFHAAESGIHHAKEFLLANSALVASYKADLLPDGTDGWLANTIDKRWQKCSEVSGIDLTNGQGTHPCFGESAVGQRANTYFYNFDSSTELPVDTNTVLPGTTEEVAIEALLCVLDIDETAAVPVQGCSDDPDVADGTYFMVTLLARGEADCNGGACGAEALVSEQVSNFGAVAGGNAPAVPLTTKSSFPPSGSAEVVPNPNAGGVGVPISVWMNGNDSCSTGSAVDPSSGSWATCEMHEWYGNDSMPEDVACTGNCNCTKAESLSYTHATDDILGIDLVLDSQFPCDLFRFYFGVPRSDYQIVKGYSKVINNCDSLNASSFGIYWVSGTSCLIASNTQVGSPDAPVMLISAAGLTKFNGGAEIFGVVFVTDVEDSNAELESNGTNTVYGSVIVDGTLGQYNGTFQVVWNENISDKAGNGGGLGAVLGGWSDFHRDWE